MFEFFVSKDVEKYVGYRILSKVESFDRDWQKLEKGGNVYLDEHVLSKLDDNCYRLMKRYGEHTVWEISQTQALNLVFNTTGNYGIIYNQ